MGRSDSPGDLLPPTAPSLTSFQGRGGALVGRLFFSLLEGKHWKIASIISEEQVFSVSFPSLTCSSLVGSIYILRRDVLEPYGNLSSPLFLCPAPPYVKEPAGSQVVFRLMKENLTTSVPEQMGGTIVENIRPQKKGTPLWKVPQSCPVSWCRRDLPWEKSIALTLVPTHKV